MLPPHRSASEEEEEEYVPPPRRGGIRMVTTKRVSGSSQPEANANANANESANAEEEKRLILAEIEKRTSIQAQEQQLMAQMKQDHAKAQEYARQKQQEAIQKAKEQAAKIQADAKAKQAEMKQRAAAEAVQRQAALKAKEDAAAEQRAQNIAAAQSKAQNDEAAKRQLFQRQQEQIQIRAQQEAIRAQAERAARLQAQKLAQEVHGNRQPIGNVHVVDHGRPQPVERPSAPTPVQQPHQINSVPHTTGKVHVVQKTSNLPDFDVLAHNGLVQNNFKSITPQPGARVFPVATPKAVPAQTQKQPAQTAQPVKQTFGTRKTQPSPVKQQTTVSNAKQPVQNQKQPAKPQVSPKPAPVQRNAQPTAPQRAAPVSNAKQPAQPVPASAKGQPAPQQRFGQVQAPKTVVQPVQASNQVLRTPNGPQKTQPAPVAPAKVQPGAPQPAPTASTRPSWQHPVPAQQAPVQPATPATVQQRGQPQQHHQRQAPTQPKTPATSAPAVQQRGQQQQQPQPQSRVQPTQKNQPPQIMSRAPKTPAAPVPAPAPETIAPPSALDTDATWVQVKYEPIIIGPAWTRQDGEQTTGTQLALRAAPFIEGDEEHPQQQLQQQQQHNHPRSSQLSQSITTAFKMSTLDPEQPEKAPPKPKVVLDDNIWQAQYRAPQNEIAPLQVEKIQIPEFADTVQVKPTVIVPLPTETTRVKWEFPEEEPKERETVPKVKAQDWQPQHEVEHVVQKTSYAPSKIARVWPPPSNEGDESETGATTKTKAAEDGAWIQHGFPSEQMTGSIWRERVAGSATTAESIRDRQWPPPESSLERPVYDTQGLVIQWPPPESEERLQQEVEIIQTHLPVKANSRQWPPPQRTVPTFQNQNPPVEAQ